MAGSSVSAFKLKLCNLLQRFCVSVSLVFRQSSLEAGVSFCCRMYKYLVETGHLRPPSITHDGCDLVKQRGRNHLCLRRRHGCYVVTSSRTSDGCDRVRPRNKRGRTRSHPPLPWKATWGVMSLFTRVSCTLTCMCSSRLSNPHRESWVCV